MYILKNENYTRPENCDSKFPRTEENQKKGTCQHLQFASNKRQTSPRLKNEFKSLIQGVL